MSLSSELRDQYTGIIDSILSKSDLNTISEKRIRKGLQDVIGYDLTAQKVAIKELIMQRFDIFAAKNGVAESPEETGASNGYRGDSASAVPSPPPSSSPVKRQPDSEEASDRSGTSPPPKKRKPDANADVDADAMFAAKLQAEENSRARPTRGGNNRRAAPVKKKSKAKTSKRVKAEDDSDVESGSDTKKEVNRTGGFHKPLNLSPALSSLLGGEVTLSRPQTVKKVWQYIRENELQDPADRRQIRCDEAMRAVFKQDRVHMFTMTKILNQNLYNPDE
ncbi:uncharacterized protein N7469_004670 [Penicillium citrinum]|uniref:DM2 domain-containing protein n=2 Tax=Penicillium TaxID=5073 RepID=A0A9W9P550_PENCI|nr:uncharacterized protein N7469_004670 [Penicillium citrinum]KAJ5235502.1 hypothetical protein N7469_004670 [Penicillium citrinum]KAJ5591067.1 hypothetical protein N7450_005039 [Penicillium hetheringtonii]KAK5800133.1 hypothetical protein VI817_002345 [Penicillium citrinum]